MLDTKSQYELAFAALFHDIGKFKQRAYKGKEDKISAKALKMETQVLRPKANGYGYGYRHALWTYDFFLCDFFPLIDGFELDINLDWEKIAKNSANHHNPEENKISEIVSLADKISAANDRSNSEVEYKRGSYYKVPLRPIFTDIELTGLHNAKKSNYYYQLTPASGSAYPIISNELQELNYLDLWIRFIADLSKVGNIKSTYRLLEKCRDLLFDYTWCIPSATNDLLNDVSLYDHSITTMALSLAIGNSEVKNPEKRVRLFAADISGIQQFIFQSKFQSFKGAAKIFRGRSFIISAISFAYKLGLCKELGIIPFVDCVDAGGKFTFILPSDENLIQKIESFVKKQELFFLKKYLGTLCVLTDYSMVVPVRSLGKNKEQGFKDVQELLAKKLNGQKQRKFFHCLDKDIWILKDVDVSKNRCIACGIRSGSEDNSENYCFECESQRKLGEEVPNSDFFSFQFKEISKNKDYEIIKGLFLSMYQSQLSDSLTYSLKGKDANFPSWKLNNYTPQKDFNQIAEASIHDNTGKPFLAYVKIDVDNLGEIFINGFPQDTYSISRYVTLSRLLHEFFNVNVKNLLKEKYPNAYTVISGGDDIFIILPWIEAVEFVLELNDLFKCYCCENQEIHFSVGILVSGKSIPFSMQNEKVNFELDQRAKEEEGKNCVAYFNTCFGYPELKKLVVDSKRIIEFVKNENYQLSSGFIYRMYKYVEDSLIPVILTSNDLKENNKKGKKYSVYSKIRYDLIRNVKTKSESGKQEVFDFFLDHFDNTDDKQREQFKVTLIHTMYQLRKSEKREGLYD